MKHSETSLYDCAEDHLIVDWNHSGEGDAKLREIARNQLQGLDRWDVLERAEMDHDLCACVIMLDCGDQFEVTVFATPSPHAAEVRLTISKPNDGDPLGFTHVVACWPDDDFTLRREFTRVAYAIEWLEAHVDTSRMVDGPPRPEPCAVAPAPPAGSAERSAGMVC